MPTEGFKSTGVTPETQSPEAQLDTLYAKLPLQLREKWETELQDLDTEEQISKVTALLERRSSEVKDHTHEARLLPEGVEIYESFPDDVREMVEMIKTSERSIEVGYGQAGHVIAHPSQPEVCYKILFDDEILPQGTNDISRETEIQHEVGELLDGAHGVLVPKVYAFISEPGTRAITMELMNAPSLRRVVERQKESMPAAFDSQKFFGALRAFITDLHEKGYYHRDLHHGNVLVHRETGMPCVIDFGLSKHAPIEDGNEYREQYIEDGRQKELVLQSDLDNIAKLETQVAEYMAKRKGVS